MNISTEIDAAISSLNLDGKVRRVPAIEASDVVSSAEARFTTVAGRRWWWEVLREDLPSCSLEVQSDTYLLVGNVCPPGAAWFIVINSTVFLFGHACCFVIIIIDLLKFK